MKGVQIHTKCLADTEKIFWQFWHTYRIEDLVSNILMVNQNQIFNTEWQKKIRASITDTGTIYGAGRMGNANIGRRRCDNRFSLYMAAGILGEADEGRYADRF